MKKSPLMRSGVVFLVVFCFITLSPSPVWAAQKKFLSIGTSQSGALFYILGGAMSRILSKNLPDVEATAEVTGGASENNILIQKKKVDLAITTTMTALWAHQGILDFKGNACPDIRVMMLGYKLYQQWFALENSGIRSLADGKGKRIGIGQPGGANEMAARHTLEAYGLHANKDYKPLYLTYREQVDAMKDGNCDLCSQFSGLPLPSILDIQSTHKLRFLDVDDQHYQTLQKLYPYYSQGIIPANIYKNQNSFIQTLISTGCIIVHKDMDPDLVYRVTKAILENNDFLKSVHPAGAEWSMKDQDNILDLALIAVHPGAIKYFKEKSIVK